MLARMTVLTLMAFAAGLGWGTANLLMLAGLVIDRTISGLLGWPTLSWLRRTLFGRIEGSAYDTAWRRILQHARDSAPPVHGRIDRIRRGWRAFVAITHRISAWAAFAFFGLSGTALTGQWLIVTILTATYPLFGIKEWAEARQSIDRQKRLDDRRVISG